MEIEDSDLQERIAIMMIENGWDEKKAIVEAIKSQIASGNVKA